MEEGGNQVLSFLVAGDSYGIDLLLVQGIIQYTQPTQVNRKNPGVLGVIRYQNEVIPVIDLRVRLGWPAKEYVDQSVIIVVRIRGKTIGIVAEGVSDIIDLGQASLHPVDSELSRQLHSRYVRTIVSHKNSSVLLLDENRLTELRESAEAIAGSS